jgi:hypothetical protein
MLPMQKSTEKDIHTFQTVNPPHNIFFKFYYKKERITDIIFTVFIGMAIEIDD